MKASLVLVLVALATIGLMGVLAQEAKASEYEHPVMTVDEPDPELIDDETYAEYWADNDGDVVVFDGKPKPRPPPRPDDHHRPKPKPRPRPDPRPRPRPDERDPEPNCRGDIGLVYGACNPRNPSLGGCSYAQFNGRFDAPKVPASLAVVFPKSSICNDTNAGGLGGRSAVAYNSKNRVEYYHTGTGANVWTILASSGAQSVFAKIPTGHPPLIGMELQGSRLWLFTSQSYYTAPVSAKYNATTVSFSSPSLLPPSVKLTTDSYVTGNGVDTLYILGFRKTLYIVNTAGPTPVMGGPVDGVPVPVAQVTQMFFSNEAGLIMQADGMLLKIDIATGTPTSLDAPLPRDPQTGDVNVIGATLSTTNYYAANSTHMMAFNTVTKTLIKYPCIAGTPILGNFVYINQ